MTWMKSEDDDDRGGWLLVVVLVVLFVWVIFKAARFYGLH